MGNWHSAFLSASFNRSLVTLHTSKRGCRIFHTSSFWVTVLGRCWWTPPCSLAAGFSRLAPASFLHDSSHGKLVVSAGLAGVQVRLVLSGRPYQTARKPAPRGKLQGPGWEGVCAAVRHLVPYRAPKIWAYCSRVGLFTIALNSCWHERKTHMAVAQSQFKAWTLPDVPGTGQQFVREQSIWWYWACREFLSLN